MKTLYLFIAQKPDSTDYCRGCRMASYSSDFFIENLMNREELIKKWAEYIQKNMNLDYNEAGYGFYVFKNGFKLFEENYPRCDRWWQHEDDKAEILEKEDMAEITEIFSEATALATKLQGDKATKEEKEKVVEAQKEAEKAKKERQLLYEKLKKEFDEQSSSL